MQEGHVYDLLPGYALGCLDAPEERQVTEHLESCEHCRAELLRYGWVVDELPMALEMSAPPAELKARILGRARQSSQPGPGIDFGHQQPAPLAAPRLGGKPSTGFIAHGSPGEHGFFPRGHRRAGDQPGWRIRRAGGGWAFPSR